MSKQSLSLRTLLPGVLLLPLLLLGAGRAAAQDTAGSFIPSTCMFEGVDLGVTQLTGEMLNFECGYVVVPVRHAAPDGPTLRLPVAVRRAPGGGAPDPLLLAQGGPGGDAFEVFSLLVPMTQIAAERDIVVFNQRGTPYATPELTCPETDAALAERLASPLDESDRIYYTALDACYQRLLAEGVDLSAFNSLENAADIPFIARALGYDVYNFYGVSYGTLLGLHLMRNHPEGLRSVILDSVVSTDINFVSEEARSETRVLREVFAACEADAACRASYPNLEQRYFALVRRYDEKPVSLTLADPETGERYEALVDGRRLRDLIFQLLYIARMNVILPRLIHDLEQGDTRYLETMWPLFVFNQLIAEGMYYSVVCAEENDIDPAAVSLADLPPEIAATVREKLQNYVAACARWAVEPLPASVDDPVVSDIPTLLLSGRFDPVTPPAFAQAAAIGLSNATTLIDPLAAHGVAFFNPCVNGIVANFLNDPATPPDSTCLDAQEPQAYVLPDAPMLPLVGEVNALRPRTLALFGVAGLLLVVVLSSFLVWPVVYIIRAFGDRQTQLTPDERRLRWISRGLVLAFGALALVFAVGLLAFIIAAIADQTLATASMLSPAARPLLWLPLVLLLLAVGILAALFILWSRRSGSAAGRVYYTVVSLCAVALVFLIGSQGLIAFN